MFIFLIEILISSMLGMVTDLGLKIIPIICVLYASVMELKPFYFSTL